MKTLIAAMLLWIGANTNYNVDINHPTIVFLSQDKLEHIYSKGKGIKNSELHGFYDTKEDIIYLPDTFDQYNAWHKGVLIHELIHYVQDQNDVKFNCTAEMEAESWPLQKKYLLEVHGVNWDYDKLWHHFQSTCMQPY